MGKTLDAFPEGNTDFVRGGRYPWGKWLDGRVWHLEKGTQEQYEAGERDFHVPIKSFRSAVTQATKAKTKAGEPGTTRTQVVDDGLIVQWLPASKAEDGA